MQAGGEIGEVFLLANISGHTRYHESGQGFPLWRLPPSPTKQKNCWLNPEIYFIEQYRENSVNYVGICVLMIEVSVMEHNNKTKNRPVEEGREQSLAS